MMWKVTCYLVFVSVAWGHSVPNSGVAPLVKLNDGNLMPKFGFGTWLGFDKKGLPRPVEDDSMQKAVEAAIDAGYRHIDTASIYDTEDLVGRAINNKIRSGAVKREDLFITTKLWNDKHARDAVVPALKESLRNLGLQYVDLYLIHWPFATFSNNSVVDTDYLETWQGMIDARSQGLARSIGVCNFNEQQLQRLAHNSEVVPAVLQVEVNLNLQQPSLLSYCREHGITVMGYTPFGSLFPSRAAPTAPPPRVDNPELVAIANRHNKSVPQIVLRYLFELGVVPIPKSITKERVEQNIDIFDFELSPEEKHTLKAFDKNYRTIDVKLWKNSPYYPF